MKNLYILMEQYFSRKLLILKCTYKTQIPLQESKIIQS